MSKSSDPSFVRLAPRLSQGTQVDLNTGWAISGLDVKPFPGNEQAAKWVRAKLRDGALEPASQAEFDEISDANEEIAALEANRMSKVLQDQIAGKLGLPQVGNGGFQESQIRATAQEHAERLRTSREKRAGGGAYEQDKKRREALAKADEEGDDGSYESWTHKDLDEELSNRALDPVKGTKAEKAAVLTQHDLDNPDEDEE